MRRYFSISFRLICIACALFFFNLAETNLFRAVAHAGSEEESAVISALAGEISTEASADDAIVALAPSADPAPAFSATIGGSGQSADISTFTGAATYSYPIIVPPGRLGGAPNIALTYNSYRKNGWVGVGWSIEMGSIQRSTRYGVDYNAADYVFVSNGSSTELVRRPDWDKPEDPDYYSYFGAKIEGEFAKFRLDTVNQTWLVMTKEGSKLYYGTTASERQADPSNSAKVFKWNLQKVQDTNGNFMKIYYTKEQGEIYLDKIEYTGNGALSPSNYVKFYLESRTDTWQRPVRSAAVLLAVLRRVQLHRQLADQT